MSVKFLGAAADLFSVVSDEFIYTPQCEPSVFQIGSTVYMYNSLGYGPEATIQYRTSTDADVAVWSAATTVAGPCPRPIIEYDPDYDCYWAFGNGAEGDGYPYLWKSTDGTTFTMVNGNQPIMSPSTGIWSHIWNVDAVKVDGVWHMLADCDQPGTNDGHVGYTFGTITEAGIASGFDSNRTQTAAYFPGGAMWIGYDSASARLWSLFAACWPSATGETFAHPVYNSIMAASVPLAEAGSRNWDVIPYADFSIYTDTTSTLYPSMPGYYGEHGEAILSDPYLASLTGKNYASYLGYSFDQGGIKAVHSTKTQAEIFAGIFTYVAPEPGDVTMWYRDSGSWAGHEAKFRSGSAWMTCSVKFRSGGEWT
jgi:hypothetical protein